MKYLSSEQRRPFQFFAAPYALARPTASASRK
jgi:hypothetical protein